MCSGTNVADATAAEKDPLNQFAYALLEADPLNVGLWVLQALDQSVCTTEFAMRGLLS